MDLLKLARGAVLAALGGVLGAGTLGACKPELDGRPSLVDGPRVLAVRAIPAEVETRDPFTLDALVVDPNGELADPLVYGFCTARKALSELGSVARACVDADPAYITPIGGVTAVMPDDACRAFGPEVPPPKAGEDPGRPVDPDLTGGYYQPVRAFGASGRVKAEIAQVRISCGVFGASAEQAADFRAHYHPNENPDIASITIDGAPAGTAAPVRVKAGSVVAVVVSWPACPSVDACGDGICGPDETRAGCPGDCSGASVRGCTGAERYAYFDAGERAVVRRRESMIASFYATSGSFAADRSGREAEDLVSSTTVAWTAPGAAGLVRAWVVLRDDRGGVAFRGLSIQVE
jgi:hypothetical protein